MDWCKNSRQILSTSTWLIPCLFSNHYIPKDSYIIDHITNIDDMESVRFKCVVLLSISSLIKSHSSHPDIYIWLWYLKIIWNYGHKYCIYCSLKITGKPNDGIQIFSPQLGLWPEKFVFLWVKRFTCHCLWKVAIKYLVIKS